MHRIKRYMNDQGVMYRLSRNLYYHFIQLIYYKGYLIRKYIPKLDKTYKRINEYKNLHKGERCFIIATGPSLTISDLEILENEITFSMNSIVMSFDRTNWRPTYYGVQDYSVYEKISGYINRRDFKEMFVSDFLNKRVKRNDVVNFPLNLMAHPVQTNTRYGTKFSDDCYLTVFDGYSITYSLIQIAVYMGFSEIYLLGADSTYKAKKQHFNDYESKDPTRETITERLFSAYNVAKKYCDDNDVKIFNATRGGVLEIFDRVNFDDVVK